MEPSGHVCTGRPCSSRQVRFLEAVLFGILFLALLAAKFPRVSAFPEANGSINPRELAGSVLSASSAEIRASSAALPPLTVSSQSKPSTDEDLRFGSAGGESEAQLQQSSGGVALDDNRKLETGPASSPLNGAIQGNASQNFGGNPAGTSVVKDASGEPLSVAERVRRRFHSQKLFQDEEEGEDAQALDPLPKSAVEEMLKEAQMQSTRADAATKGSALHMDALARLVGEASTAAAEAALRIAAAMASVSMECASAQMAFWEKTVRENYESETGECPNDCSGNGTCDPFTRQCTCNEGFIGRSCGEERCPNSCLPNGQCADNGRCMCKLGYGGSDCSVGICPNSCSGLGVCSSIGCLCYEGSGGVDCSQPQKANRATPFGCASDADCSHRGSCEAGRCICNTGFEGDCSELARDIFSAVCKHSSSLYVLAFDTNVQPDIKTW
ncbi:hypothetical protein Efla_003105 [Eimeria flavescens]